MIVFRKHCKFNGNNIGYAFIIYRDTSGNSEYGLTNHKSYDFFNEGVGTDNHSRGMTYYIDYENSKTNITLYKDSCHSHGEIVTCPEKEFSINTIVEFDIYNVQESLEKFEKIYLEQLIMKDGYDKEQVYEAWASHLYMNDNVILGTFDTEQEAKDCITKRLQESAHLKVWTHTWIKAVPPKRQ